MKIEIWSDLVCPWCYIGKRRFETALKDFVFAEHLDIEWKSYQLDSEMETNSTLNIYQYLSEKKAMTLQEAKTMSDYVAAVAAKEGLPYDFSKIIPVNTIKAHRLLHFAKTQNRQDQMKEALLNGYFIKGKNLDDNHTLLAIAKEVGLEREAVLEVLESDAFVAAVKSDIHEAEQLGVRGVPFFVFDRKYGISGAQEAKVFSQTLEKAFANWVKNNPNCDLKIIEGKVCTPDGICG